MYAVSPSTVTKQAWSLLEQIWRNSSNNSKTLKTKVDNEDHVALSSKPFQALSFYLPIQFPLLFILKIALAIALVIQGAQSVTERCSRLIQSLGARSGIQV